MHQAILHGVPQLASVKRGTEETYTIDSVANATSYTWSVPSGATITSGQGTTSVAVMFGDSSGNVAVKASNACGTSDSTVLAVSVGDSTSNVRDDARSFSAHLFQNFPNPFYDETRIVYEIAQSERVTLTLYDMMGRECAVLVSQEKQVAGRHEVSLDASQFESGMYYYQLRARGFVATRMMIRLNR